MSWTQDDHKLLSVPGPVECSDEVLLANAHPSVSHVAPGFLPVFGNCLRMLRKLLYTESGQPFIIAGSGTLGWDIVASNLMESGEEALVLNSGYFGDAFADCIETYGGKVTQVKAPVGGTADLKEVEEALKKDKYKVLTFTHVDTCELFSPFRFHSWHFFPRRVLELNAIVVSSHWRTLGCEGDRRARQASFA
jgi:alanine-glyoxylate transaminase/serine-glyoxylate transaminase/serine-pyruvate transaminase